MTTLFRVTVILLLIKGPALKGESVSLVDSNDANMTAEDFQRMAADIREKAAQQSIRKNESDDEKYKRARKLSIILKKGEYNTPIAHQLFKELAESGNSQAAFDLAFDYEHGRGVKADPKKAFEWYKKAANWGNVDALYEVGSCYYNGTGVQKNFKKALNLFLDSAYKGNKRAFSVLSSMYWYGKGTTKDEIEALAWIYVDDANSNYDKTQKGINALNSLERELGNRATFEAQQRAKEISNKINVK